MDSNASSVDDREMGPSPDEEAALAVEKGGRMRWAKEYLTKKRGDPMNHEDEFSSDDGDDDGKEVDFGAAVLSKSYAADKILQNLGKHYATDPAAPLLPSYRLSMNQQRAAEGGSAKSATAFSYLLCRPLGADGMSV